jgi:hypothetical protein
MAHYAFLDRNNKVVQVIVGKDEGDTDWEQYYGSKLFMPCKRTSYNTRGGVHTQGGTPFRKNYAGIDYTYDSYRDAFIPPKPYPSWKLNEETCLWEAPKPLPEDDGSGDPPKMYVWDEYTTEWVLPKT